MGGGHWVPCIYRLKFDGTKTDQIGVLCSLDALLMSTRNGELVQRTGSQMLNNIDHLSDKGEVA